MPTLVEKIVNRVGEQGFPLRREDVGEFDQTTEFHALQALQKSTDALGSAPRLAQVSADIVIDQLYELQG